jgi:hypothetical protein
MLASIHGYAIVRGGTAYPVDGSTFDVVAVEMKKPDGTVIGPYAGPGGRPRGRAAHRFAGDDVIAMQPSYPKPSAVYAALRDLAARRRTGLVETLTSVARIPARRLAPRTTGAALASSTFQPIALHRFAKKPTAPMTVSKGRSAGQSVVKSMALVDQPYFIPSTLREHRAYV